MLTPYWLKTEASGAHSLLLRTSPGTCRRRFLSGEMSWTKSASLLVIRQVIPQRKSLRAISSSRSLCACCSIAAKKLHNLSLQWRNRSYASLITGCQVFRVLKRRRELIHRVPFEESAQRDADIEDSVWMLAPVPKIQTMSLCRPLPIALRTDHGSDLRTQYASIWSEEEIRFR